MVHGRRRRHWAPNWERIRTRMWSVYCTPESSDCAHIQYMDGGALTWKAHGARAVISPRCHGSIDCQHGCRRPFTKVDK